jgi:hypothetical protein
MKKIFSLITLCVSLSAFGQTPVLFTMQSLTGQANNRSILVQPDRTPATPLWYGTNLVPVGDFTLQPIAGQVLTNLIPWGYTVRVDGWPRGVHIVVPNTSTIQNAVSLINTNQFSPLQLFQNPLIPLQQIVRLALFGAGYGESNGVQFLQGITPTNFVLPTKTAAFLDTNGPSSQVNNQVRDPFPMAFTVNGQTEYIMTWTHYGLTGPAGPGIGIAISPDSYSWQFVGYAPITNLWSPKFFTDANNGLHCIAMTVDDVTQAATNYVLLDVNSANLTNITNLRAIVLTNVYMPDSYTGFYPNGGNNSVLQTNQPQGGCVLWDAGTGLYRFFSGQGGVYTNPTLSGTGWDLETPHPATQAPDVQAMYGSAVFNFGGTWYWFATYGGLQYYASTSLTGWNYGAGPTPVSYPSYAQASGDGGFLVINMPNSAPAGYGLTTQNYLVATGASPLDGSGLTNLQSTSIVGGLNVIVTNLWSTTVSNRLYFTNGILVKFTSP